MESLLAPAGGAAAAAPSRECRRQPLQNNRDTCLCPAHVHPPSNTHPLSSVQEDWARNCAAGSTLGWACNVSLQTRTGAGPDIVAF